MNKIIKGLQCYRQVNADGSSFISCSGSVENEAVAFTLPDAKVRPVARGKQYPVKDNPNRFFIPCRDELEITVVDLRQTADPAEFDVKGNKKCFAADLDYRVLPTDHLWENGTGKVAAKKATSDEPVI